MDSEVVTRLNHVQTETLKLVAAMTQAQLAFYASRASGGSMRVGEAIAQIAAHDNEHIEQLKRMQGAARSGGGR
jgi:hypothetical protein